jgi:hypothetical protein
MAQTGKVGGARPKRAGARHTSGLLDSLWGAASSMAEPPLAPPRTKDGLARLTEAKTKHGKFTKEKRAEARRFAEEGRQMRGELKELETWFVDHGHLDKNWRDWFK